MFYHENSEIIDTLSSYLDPHQVFTGNYWDEFGFTSFLVPNNAKVLMLGLASGGGLRPLFSSTKNIQLKCVDMDTKSIESCRQIFDQNYSKLQFEIINAEAKKFLQNSNDLYDLIWLDLYHTDSYSELYFDQDFLALLKLHLGAKGVLAVNAYGLPTHFNPLSTASVQRECARRLQQHFPFLGTIPNRRNQTLLASATRPSIHETQPSPTLSALDKRSFLVQGARLQHLQEIPKLSEITMDLTVSARFNELDRQMRNSWQDVLQTLRFYDVSLNGPMELLNFIQNQKQCEAFLEKSLLSQNYAAIEFVPILCAGESYIHDLDVSWIFPWILKNHPQIPQNQRSRFLQVWLTQLWFLILHPSKKYRPYCFQIFALFKETL